MSEITPEALQRAFDYLQEALDTFIGPHAVEPTEHSERLKWAVEELRQTYTGERNAEALQAMRAMCLSVGVDAETLDAFRQMVNAFRAEGIDAAGWNGGALVGFVVGLTAQSLSQDDNGPTGRPR